MVQYQTPIKKVSAFTLVELIVVITILAILGTIGFLSLGGYSSNSRDSQRTADVANVAKSLDAYVITAGSYPSPDNSFSVTYSWAAVWYQWNFGTGAHQKLGGTWIAKRPLDPLKNTEYAYSVLAFWKAYQIKADFEGTVTASNPLVPSAYAAVGIPDVAMVRGNYGGLVARTETGSLVYVLAVPSILTNTGSSGQSLNISSNALSWTLLFNGKKLANASSFNPNVVVFSGSSLPKDDSSGQVTTMMTALKSAYASSDLASSVPSVQSVTNTATWGLATFGSSVITAQLGWNATPGGGTNNLVSGACTGLPTNAAYYGNATSYSLSSASAGTSLAASYNASPSANTCQYQCKAGYVYSSGVCNDTWAVINTTGISGWSGNVGLVKITSTITTYRNFIDLCKAYGFKWLASNYANNNCYFDEAITNADSLQVHNITCNMSWIFVSGSFPISTWAIPTSGKTVWWPATDLGHQGITSLDQNITSYWGNTTFTSNQNAIITNKSDHYTYPTSLPVGDWIACWVAR